MRDWPEQCGRCNNRIDYDSGCSEGIDDPSDERIKGDHCDCFKLMKGNDDMPSEVAFRVEYDDDGTDVIAKVNQALEEHGLKFITDDDEHDGFQPYWLVKMEEQ